MTQAKPMDYAALGIKVEALEGDVREVKDSLLGLNSKFDNAVTSLSQEFRSAISALSNQFSERQRTPWGVLISGAMALVVVLGIVGSQAMSPLQADLKALKEQIVPREEINYRAEVANRRWTAIEAGIDQIQRRRNDELHDEIRRLQGDLNDARRNK